MILFLQKGTLNVSLAAREVPSSDGAIVTKAVMKAVDRLGISNRALARVLGLSEASISRMGSGSYTLAPRDKSFEVAVLFLRLFRSLDAIVGGDDAAARGWMEGENVALGGTPRELVQTLSGLVNVVGYLDARRAVV
jgi:Protein of unknown function (DUF2384)